MEISTQELLTFAALLGAALVGMIGLGVRMIFVSFRYEGKERNELFISGLAAIILFGGFFLAQLVRVIIRF
jgi:hypothetical protein